MAHQVPWNETIYTEFCRAAMLSDREREVLRTRIMGYSISEQADLLRVSKSTISRAIEVLKKKYDRVQKLNPSVLPERTTSAEETWMDTH